MNVLSLQWLSRSLGLSIAIGLMPAALAQTDNLSLTPAAGGGVVTAKVRAQAVDLRDQALAGSKAFDWVESLTTEVGPRLAGTAAEARARDWAVDTLTTLGFENVRVEPFTMDGWERGLERGAILQPFPQPLTLTALGGSVATKEAGLKFGNFPRDATTDPHLAEVDLYNL